MTKTTEYIANAVGCTLTGAIGCLSLLFHAMWIGVMALVGLNMIACIMGG